MLLNSLNRDMFKPFRSHSGLLGWVKACVLEDMHRFWVSFRETHLWEHFGRRDQIALTMCLKKLNVSGASLILDDTDCFPALQWWRPVAGVLHGKSLEVLWEVLPSKSWFSGRGWGQQLFTFQSPAVHWIARTSSLNCLSCRNPYQTPHSLNCLPPFHWKPLFFHWKVLRRIPSPKIGSDQGCSGKSGCSGVCLGELGVLQGVLPRVLFLFTSHIQHSREHSLEHPQSPKHTPEHPDFPHSWEHFPEDLQRFPM